MRAHPTEIKRVLALIVGLAVATGLVATAGEGDPPRNGRVVHAPKPHRLATVSLADLPSVGPLERLWETVENLEAETYVPDPAPRVPPGGAVPDRLVRVERVETATTTVPALDVSFEALGPQGNPPDPTGAAGPDHVVVLINFQIAVYDRSGNLLQGPTSLEDFFGLPPEFNDFDPLAIYDPWSGHFIVSTLARYNAMNESRIYVAFSRTSDATGEWNTYWIDADRDQPGDHWADYHSVGIDRNAVYYTANMIPRTTGVINVTVFIYDKEDGYAGLPLDNTHLIDVKESDGSVPFRLRPAYVSEVVPGDEYYLARAQAAFGDVVEVLRLTGDRFVNPTVSAEAVALPAHYSTASWARQPVVQQQVATLNGRLFNAFYRAGKIWTAHAVDATDGSLVAWVHRIDVSQDPAVLEQTYEVGSPTADVYVPHVIPDTEDNDFALLTAYSGPSDFVTSRYWNISADGIVRHEENVLPGADVTFSSRFGDYFAAYPDPSDGNRVWMVGMFVPTLTPGKTIVGSALFETPGTAPPPTPDGKTINGAPLAVAKAGADDLTVTWGDAGCTPADNHLVWFDLLDIASYTITGSTCDIGVGGSWTGTPPIGLLGVIAVSDDDATVEGSHGVDWQGVERPSRLLACGLTEKQTDGSCP